MQTKKRILSAIQPTGNLHYGNYFGAVQNWVALQKDYECIYGVVDYHAMSMPYDPKKLRENTWSIIFNLIAVGVDVDNLFIQSLVPEHAELCWIFNCFCSYGQLSRMTQFKDKSQHAKENAKDDFISAGLFDYPVLQAADILIYKADYVPVGKDQEQHLELTRNIAERFNHQIGKEYFVLPEALFTEIPKVMSTADPSRKMSKSAGDKHHINVFADEQQIRKQIRSAVTDTGESGNAMSPGVENLFSLLKASGSLDLHREFLAQYDSKTIKYAELKDAVSEGLVKLSNYFAERKLEVEANKKEIKYKIKASSARIRSIAQETVKEVKELTGLANIKF